METGCHRRRGRAAPLVVAATLALAVTATARADYTDYYFDVAGPLDSLEIHTRWNNAPDPAYVYPAFTFIFESGGGGYMGTQLIGNSHKALFSIWDVTVNGYTAIPTGNCNRFGAETEGTGAQCGISYDWAPGREYRLRVAPDSPVSGGERWRGTIQDTQTGIETLIGVIELRNSGGFIGYGRLRPSASIFLEYFATACQPGGPYASVTWRGPYGNAGSVAARQAIVPFYPSCPATDVCSSGPLHVTHMAGGATRRITPSPSELWADPVEGDADGDGACDGSDNCPATPNPGQQDGNGNGTGDACDPATMCAGAASGTPCDDHDPCTTNDRCSSNACVGGPPPNCDDGNGITTDLCLPSSGCFHALQAEALLALLSTILEPECSNGVVDPAEECDDGNTYAGDCCAPTCEFDAAGTLCGGGCNTCDGAGVCR